METVSFEHAPRFKKNKTIKEYHFKKKKKALILEFDEKAREDFLSGFRKRKLQRKKKAQEELEKQVKEERKKVRHEAKNAFKKLVVSHRDIPDFGLIKDEGDIVDMKTHEVQITEVDPMRLAMENNWIGANQMQKELSESENEESDHEEKDEIEGMGFKNKQPQKKNRVDIKNLTNIKDVKKYVKQVATKTVQKSQAFRKKKEVESVKNKKKKRREERAKEKSFKNMKKRRNNPRNRNE